MAVRPIDYMHVHALWQPTLQNIWIFTCIMAPCFIEYMHLYMHDGNLPYAYMHIYWYYGHAPHIIYSYLFALWQPALLSSRQHVR